MTMVQEKKLTPTEDKILKKMFWKSLKVFQGFTMVKMEANGFTMTMSPAIEEIYKNDPEGKKDAYRRHQNFFNTHAVPFSFIAGLTAAMEKEHEEKHSIDTTTIENIKVALMGPTAGMFDSLFFNCLRIIAAGVAIGLNQQGNFFGTILFILIYGFPQLAVKYYFVRWGYTLGTSFIDEVFSSGLMNALTKATGIMGLIMVGYMCGTMVNVPLNWTLTIGQSSVVFADVFNSIFPGFLGIVLLFTLVRLIKKGVRPVQLVMGILVFGLVGALIGIF